MVLACGSSDQRYTDGEMPMDRPLLPPLASLMLVTGASLAAIYVSISYVGGAVASLVAESSESSAAEAPQFVADVEPLPSGSVSAIVPIPAAPAEPEPVTPAADVTPPPADTSAQPAVIASATPETVVNATTEVETPADASGARMVATIAVNVRDRPSNNSNVIGTLPSGVSVAVLDDHQGWIRISDGGRTGWVYGRYLDPVN